MKTLALRNRSGFMVACAAILALTSGCQNSHSNPPPPPQPAAAPHPAQTPAAGNTNTQGQQGQLADRAAVLRNLSGRLDLSMIVKEDATVDLFDDSDTSKFKSIHLMRGTPIDVHGYMFNGEMALVTFDLNDPSIPAQGLMRVSELIRIADQADRPLTPLDANVSSLVDSDAVFAENAARHGTPSCFRDVKNQLLRMHLVNTYPPGGAAWMGYSILTKLFGFVPISFSQNLPNGAVCVSEGGRYQCGPKKCGHIAVKIGPFRWYGAGVFSEPLLEGHHNLRCVVKRRH